ncbi:MAG: Nif3-like dinuclear metal center hexameric protein [Clostridia bacterium]|nr:Nif3-like dinuclear metal center hexameric protein [Clostridia bacterium]
MKINELFLQTEKLAPVSISDEFCLAYNDRDNSGIIVETDKDIKSVLFTLDLTVNAVNYAIINGFDCVITHHPAIYHPLYRISTNTAIYKAIQNGIGVISCHLNLDSTKGGIDECLAVGLGGKIEKGVHVFESGCSYGKISKMDGLTAGKIFENAKKEFRSDKIMLYGNPLNVVNSMASYCGAGLSESEVENVKVDLYVSSDVKHSTILKVVDSGKNLIILTHYSSEFYGFSKFYEKLKSVLNVKCELLDEEIYL